MLLPVVSGPFAAHAAGAAAPTIKIVAPTIFILILESFRLT
jgi:hypothetical protein